MTRKPLGFPIRVLASALLVAVSACGGDDGDTGDTRESLVVSWSNPAPWCNRQRQCDVLADDCEDGWQERSDVEEAVAQLPDATVDRCLAASEEIDSCVLVLSCTALADYFCVDEQDQPTGCSQNQPCRDEQEDLQEQCEELIDLLNDGIVSEP